MNKYLTLDRLRRLSIMRSTLAGDESVCDTPLEEQRRFALENLVILRMMIRQVQESIYQTEDYIARLKRDLQKMQKPAQEVAFPLAEAGIMAGKVLLRFHRDNLVKLGEASEMMFDMWQDCGATIADLLGFLNCNFEEMWQRAMKTTDSTFADLIFIYGLDAHEDADCLVDREDAPFTRAIMAAARSEFHQHGTGRMAERIAFQEAFPDAQFQLEEE